MSIVKCLHIFCAILSYSFSGILVVRSPEGLQFARSVGTLEYRPNTDQNLTNDDEVCIPSLSSIRCTKGTKGHIT